LKEKDEKNGSERKMEMKMKMKKILVSLLINVE